MAVTAVLVLRHQLVAVQSVTQVAVVAVLMYQDQLERQHQVVEQVVELAHQAQQVQLTQVEAVAGQVDITMRTAVTAVLVLSYCVIQILAQSQLVQV
jgi:inorganic pyrophosphatase